METLFCDMHRVHPALGALKGGWGGIACLGFPPMGSVMKLEPHGQGYEGALGTPWTGLWKCPGYPMDRGMKLPLGTPWTGLWRCLQEPHRQGYEAAIGNPVNRVMTVPLGTPWTGWWRCPWEPHGQGNKGALNTSTLVTQGSLLVEHLHMLPRPVLMKSTTGLGCDCLFIQQTLASFTASLPIWRLLHCPPLADAPIWDDHPIVKPVHHAWSDQPVWETFRECFHEPEEEMWNRMCWMRVCMKPCVGSTSVWMQVVILSAWSRAHWISEGVTFSSLDPWVCVTAGYVTACVHDSVRVW